MIFPSFRFFYSIIPYFLCNCETRGVIFIDKDGGFFLKSAPKGALEREAVMMRYFHGKGLAANVLAYISSTREWLLTDKVQGDDCTAAKYLEQPERLCEIFAERLAVLHAENYIDLPRYESHGAVSRQSGA